MRLIYCTVVMIISSIIFLCRTKSGKKLRKFVLNCQNRSRQTKGCCTKTDIQDLLLYISSHKNIMLQSHYKCIKIIVHEKIKATLFWPLNLNNISSKQKQKNSNKYQSILQAQHTI